jgi:hypothetical protein
MAAERSLSPPFHCPWVAALSEIFSSTTAIGVHLDPASRILFLPLSVFDRCRVCEAFASLKSIQSLERDRFGGSNTQLLC